MSLVKAKEILDNNQYPKSFYNPIITETLEKIRTTPQHIEEISITQHSQTGENRTFSMLIQYRGAVTDKFVLNLRAANAPVQPVITLRKSRTFI